MKSILSLLLLLPFIGGDNSSYNKYSAKDSILIHNDIMYKRYRDSSDYYQNLNFKYLMEINELYEEAEKRLGDGTLQRAKLIKEAHAKDLSRDSIWKIQLRLMDSTHKYMQSYIEKDKWYPMVIEVDSIQ